MSEWVRILYHEAEDVRAIINDFLEEDACYCGPHVEKVEDLINRIGEIYETALARGSRASAQA